MISKILLSGIILLQFGFVHAAIYTLDGSHTEIGFSVKHLMLSNVKGRFNKFEGSFDFDAEKQKLEKVNVTINVSSIDTNEKKRDDHLRSPDFFNVEKFEKMTFVGEKAIFKNKKPVQLIGELTIKDKTQKVTLDLDMKGAINDPFGNHRVVFSATTKINRKDFGITWNKPMDKGGVVVGDEIAISIDGEAILKK